MDEGIKRIAEVAVLCCWTHMGIFHKQYSQRGE